MKCTAKREMEQLSAGGGGGVWYQSWTHMNLTIWQPVLTERLVPSFDAGLYCIFVSNIIIVTRNKGQLILFVEWAGRILGDPCMQEKKNGKKKLN